jgi:hypothetical protein
MGHHRYQLALFAGGALALSSVMLAQAGHPTTGSAGHTTATFSTPVGLAGGVGGEPSVATDRLGNVLIAGPQGVPGGSGAYWVSHNHGAQFGSAPTYANNTATIYGGATGGGDEDIAFNPNDGSPYAGRIYIADLAATHSTVCFSTDHGNTFNAVGPAPDPRHCQATTLGATTPSSDRQWLTADRNGRAYITDHEFVSAQPRMWTTTNGGADQFVTPCGPIVTDPTIEANVPTDVTGGTLVSKPVVDSAGNVYVLFTTTTQAQNAAAIAAGQSSGTFSQAYLAVSNDHCISFTDRTIFDGVATHPANSVQFGDIFNELVIDPAGNLYAVAAGYIGTTPFAKTADIYLFTSTNHGVSWSPYRQLTRDIGAHVLPAAAAGLSAGQLAIGYFRTTNGNTDPNNAADVWTYTAAESTNALSLKTAFSFTDVPAAAGTTGNTYHYGDICTSGILCGTGIPGTGTDRSLLDFTSAAVDANGCMFFTFAGNPKSAATNMTEPTLNYETKQQSACFTIRH